MKKLIGKNGPAAAILVLAFALLFTGCGKTASQKSGEVVGIIGAMYVEDSGLSGV